MSGKAKSVNGDGTDAQVVAAEGRNPNVETSLNDSPEGPEPHLLGHTGDGGMSGKTTVSGRGVKFTFQ